MKKYPISRPHQKTNQLSPVVQPNNALPQVFKTLSEGSRHSNHNICGQSIVFVEMEDKYGNKIRMKSRNQIIDLVNGARGYFHVGDNSGRCHKPNRRKK